MEDLSALPDVVRRVIAARVSEPHLVEDLTQETLLHVAGTDRALSDDERQAYAIVTARNLVIDHARRQSVHDRHVHRLVDYTSFTGPEQATLEQEETEALTQALQRLPVADRTLLVRHEVEGERIEALAAEVDTTPGALATRLSRARATLRLDFVLAYRRATLPTPRCRPVLLALSTGDRRRQRRLDAAGHVRSCETCAELAAPVSERRRGIAAWLLLPIAEGVRRLAGVLRRNHWAQAAAAAGATAVVATAIGLNASDDGAAPADPIPSVATSTVTSPSTATPSTAAPSTAAPSTAAPSTAAPSTTLASLCPVAQPLDDMRAAPPIGCPIADTTVMVLDVPEDEGFWAQNAGGTTLWIQLTGEGESPVEVEPGSRLTVHGTVTEAAMAPDAAADPRVTGTGFVVSVPFDAVRAS